MPTEIVILSPVYNDGESFNILLSELAAALNEINTISVTMLAVDDGSTEPLSLKAVSPFKLQILRLRRNIGHQKAIAVGMAYIKENMRCDKVLIMDSDGEDRPADAIALIRQSMEQQDKIIFAQRKSRQENSRFRFFYWLYKIAFRILTGRKISFGNFMIIPKTVLDKAVFYSEIWNHIAGGMIKTGLAYSSIPANRGKRYAGNSKMNFNSLLIHGLGAIAVFIEVIASRLLLFSVTLIAISVVAILALIGIKTFTDFAIPGWTSTVASAMLIILLQSFLLSLFTIFLFLSSQSQRKFIPAHHYKDYTGSIETVA